MDSDREIDDLSGRVDANEWVGVTVFVAIGSTPMLSLLFSIHPSAAITVN